MKKSLFLALVLLSGCSTRGRTQIEEQDRALPNLRKAILSVMGTARTVSENQREYSSPYFSRGFSEKFDPERSVERAYATFTILGDRRPYTIEIVVSVEKRIGKKYNFVGTDKKIANDLKKELKEKLAQSQDGVNVIDGFRPF